MSASAALRIATAPAHAAIDAAYGRFDLRDGAGYAGFLHAHARVLPPVEALLARVCALPVFAPRTVALLDDMTRMGAVLPGPLAISIGDDDAAAWGVFYVVEGSRLGGVMLARDVAPGLPTGYLSAGHGRGGWRDVRAAIDAAGDAAADDATWIARAVAAANRCFGWYGQAAA